MSSPLIEVLGVTKEVSDSTGRLTILHEIGFTLAERQSAAIVGASGSGKSTLLSIIAGYEWPSRGTVSVLGAEYGRCYMPDIKRRIGLVSAALGERVYRTDTALDVATSGLYASLGPWQTFTDADRARGRAALERIGAERCAAQRFATLSQGERQRALIARALVHEPPLLILDEPCAGLDPVARERFLADVARVCGAAGGPTLLLVTHHVEEIPTLVTHALWLRGGRILTAGPAREVLTSTHASAALGAPCEIDERAGRYALRAVERP